MNRQDYISKTNELYSHLSNQVLQYYQNINIEDKVNSYEDLQTAHENSAVNYSKGIGFVIRINGLGLICREQTSLGNIGISGIRYIFNVYLSKIIDCIYEHRGDILHFSDSGDLVICTFSTYATASNKTRPTDELMIEFYSDYQNALSCAMKLKDMDVIINQNELKRVYIQSFISFGTQQLLLVGGYVPAYLKKNSKSTISSSNSSISSNHWIYSMNGSAYMHTHCNLLEYNTSIILIEKSCYEIFQNKMIESKLEIISTLTSSGDYDVTEIKTTHIATNEIHNTLQIIENEFLMNYIHSNFIPSADDHAYTFEFKNMFCVFIKIELTTITYNEVIDSKKIQELVVKLQETISEHETTLRKVLILNNYLISSAFWDIPNTYQSHSQLHSKRCMRNEKSLLSLGAGVKLREMVEKLGMKCNIGLSSGQVLCGVMGNSLRSQVCIVGSAVERAAILVRNNPIGGIYMDQNTFIRLPFYLLERVIKYPIKTSPHTAEIGNTAIFNYNCRALINSGEPDFYEIRNITKDILLDHLDSIKGMITATTATNIRHKSMKMDELSSYTSLLKSKTLKIIVIEGSYGSGRKSTFDWLSTQASTLEITYYSQKLSFSDGLVGFTLIAKIFRMLVKDEMMDNLQRQTILVSKILKDVYKDKPLYARNVAFPAMQTALRVTCEVDFRILFPMLHANNTNSASRMKNNEESVSHILDAKLTNPDILDVIKDILGYLLKSKPVMISIMNIHFIDERSAKALLYLSNIECRSVFVFSSGSIDEKFIYPLFYKSAYFFKPKISSSIHNKTQDIINSRSYLTWFSSVRELLSLSTSTTIIYLDDLTLSDIEKKLRVVLESSDTSENYYDIDNEVIDKAVNMIHKFAAKKLFWIQQCIFLVKTIGIDVFMKVIEQSQCEDVIAINEEEVPIPTHEILATSDNEMIDKLAATASLFIETKSSFSFTASKNTLLTDGIKYKHLITTRFNMLSREDRRVLLCAAIIGFQFNLNDLLYIVPYISGEYSVSPEEVIDISAITASLISLCKSNWILQTTMDRNDYDFNHPIIYLLVNDNVSDVDRALLHDKMVICMHKTYPKISKEHFGLLSMHLSFFNTTQALEYTVKYVMHSMKVINFQIHVIQILELLYFSVFYCVNTVEVTILGKLILLIKYVLAQFNENPKSINVNSTSKTIGSIRKSIPDKKRSGFLIGIIQFFMGNKNNSTTTTNTLTNRGHKLNAVVPLNQTATSSNVVEVSSQDDVQSFHSNSSQNSSYSTISAIMGTKSKDIKENIKVYYFTNTSIEHIAMILDELGSLIGSVYNNFNNRGLNKQPDPWHHEALHIINNLFEQYDLTHNNKISSNNNNNDGNTNSKVSSVRSAMSIR